MRPAIITLIIIGILLIIYLIYRLIKKQNKNNIDELKERKKTLIEGVPTIRLETLRSMKLSGKSKEKAARLESDWRQIHSGKNITVENRIIQALEMNERGRFSKSRDFQNQAHEEMDNIEVDLQRLTKALDELINQHDDNEQHIRELRRAYKDIRQKLITETASYGLAIEHLEDKLVALEELFDQYTQLTNAGDHEQAKERAIKIDNQLADLAHLMQEIPGLLNTIDSVFYEQIDEVREGHKTLVKQGFVFGGTPIPKELEVIEVQIEEIQDQIGNLEIKKAKEAEEDIASRIDHLYDKMEIEIYAKESVEEKLESSRRWIYFLSEEVRVLFFEIDRVSQSYVLVNDEADQIVDLRDAVNQADEAYKKIVDGIENNFAIFSETERDLDELNQILGEIEKEKESVTQQLNAYQDQEAQLKADLQAMQQVLKGQKHIINENNLPGVPSDYSEYYNYVADSLMSLEEELSRPKLKVERINEFYEISTEEVEILKQRTDELIRYANLTEDAAQALYRYKDEHPEVVPLIRQSEQLFNDVYDYESSYKILKNKLLQIGPEDVNRIENQG